MVNTASLAKYFWDVNIDKIDFENDYLYVINRLLDKGDLSAGSWVLKNYSKNKIIETLKSRHDFSPQVWYFLGQLFKYSRNGGSMFETVLSPSTKTTLAILNYNFLGRSQKVFYF